uniref:Uncharacterized protein n=1 Tax=Arundo donax TaxID=35708 RepID=A0A0A8YKT4_ARUDO
MIRSEVEERTGKRVRRYRNIF